MTDQVSPQPSDISKINVLDHGFVRLVDSMGSDISVVRSARVSYDAEWRAGVEKESDNRLLHYLWRNRHTSPFESVTFTFEIKAPIFVFRQWHRHRTWSYNELSARYKELPEEFYVPDPELVGQQAEGNKQCRIIQIGGVKDVTTKASEIIKAHSEQSFKVYRELLSQGICCPRELARSVLPVNTYSHMFATVNLLNLLRFITLRSHDHAQYEIQVYSNAMKELIRPIVPVCLKAFDASSA